jgi:mono/diheme cytochrome c family protein
MKLHAVALASAVALGGPPAALAAPLPAPPQAASAPLAAEVGAGAYLAEAAHCAACHTSRDDRPYAGNLAIVSPFGTMYSSNITPDPRYGIGEWTEQEFAAALRDGKGRHGTYLYPSMPYTEFTKISDADVHALWLYFRSVTPIAEKATPNRMRFPFNVRTGIGAWQAVYFRPGRYVDDPTQSAQWNRGAYLVQGLGHCGACHTPRNVAMAEKTGKALQGAETDHWFAPDISGGRFTGIRDWSEAQIVAYLKTGHNDKNVAAVGPMLQTIAMGTQHLEADDLEAIAVYLKHQVAGTETAPPRAPVFGDERRAAGVGIYAANCQSCHGVDGKGVYGVAPALAANSAVTAQGPQTVIRAVLEGFAPHDRWGVMPSFAETLDGQSIADVVNHVRTAWGNAGAPNASASQVNHLRDYANTDNPAVQAAVICPSAPAEALDAETLRQIAVLAKQPDAGVRVPAQLVSGYRRRHPGSANADVVDILSGAYCRDVMAVSAGSYMEKQSRFISFMAAVSAASTKPH